MQHYWLFKSEPNCFSIDDLRHRPNQTTHWDGVRNYQVRNLLRDTIKKGDQAFFYHSSCNQPGIVGTIAVVSGGYPDFTAWDRHAEHYDPKSSAENPRWFMVDVKLMQKFSRGQDALNAQKKNCRRLSKWIRRILIYKAL